MFLFIFDRIPQKTTQELYVRSSDPRPGRIRHFSGTFYLASGGKTKGCTTVRKNLHPDHCELPTNLYLRWAHVSNLPDKTLFNKGNLPDGTQYYVYRTELYADAFEQHKAMTDARSVAEVYVVPL